GRRPQPTPPLPQPEVAPPPAPPPQPIGLSRLGAKSTSSQRPPNVSSLSSAAVVASTSRPTIPRRIGSIASLMTKPIKPAAAAAVAGASPLQLPEDPQGRLFHQRVSTGQKTRRVPKKKAKLDEDCEKRRQQFADSKKKSRADPARKRAEQDRNTSLKRESRQREKLSQQ
ncbi:unnamed protein product, partial [Allacma fusca]